MSETLKRNAMPALGGAGIYAMAEPLIARIPLDTLGGQILFGAIAVTAIICFTIIQINKPKPQ